MKPKYFYKRVMGHYSVYQNVDDWAGTKIGHFQNEEEARKEVYRLNGWKYKPKKTEPK